jgi:hypothetical protein
MQLLQSPLHSVKDNVRHVPSTTTPQAPISQQPTSPHQASGHQLLSRIALRLDLEASQVV